jgi:hypothetical protein
VSAIVPKAGEWVLFRDSDYAPFRVAIKQAAKVTPKLVRFEGTQYPRQCSLLNVTASFASEEVAKRVAEQIGGVGGKFEKRRRAAEDERSSRITAARAAAEAQVIKIVARASDILAAAPGEVK